MISAVVTGNYSVSVLGVGSYKPVQYFVGFKPVRVQSPLKVA